MMITMRRLYLVANLLLVGSITVTAVLSSSSSLSRTFAGRSALFGVPRGGGLFGGNDKNDKASKESDSGVDDDSSSKKKYAPMTKEEIQVWLEHIPVFAVTDPNGAGVVLKPENDTSVFYFFLNPMQANATLTQLKAANEEMELKVSAFSLGKIWFNLLNGEDGREVLLKSPTDGDKSEGEMTKGVQYRLVPDMRDLLGARMLLTTSPEDGLKMKEEGMTQELAQKALKKAMEESPKFKNNYNEIPIFTIAQMRMQKQPAEGESGEPVTLLPMYFSLQNMVSTWQQFMSKQSTEMQSMEPAINLLSLHDLIGLMQKESEVDWRSVVLVPYTPPSASSSGPGTPTVETPDAMAQMGGATLGDI